MSSCPLYNSSNLNYTGSKSNNPYSLIQKAGKRRRKSMTKKRKTKTKRRNTRRRKR